MDGVSSLTILYACMLSKISVAGLFFFHMMSCQSPFFLTSRIAMEDRILYRTALVMSFCSSRLYMNRRHSELWAKQKALHDCAD